LSYYYSLANKFFDYIHAGVPSINMMFPEYVAINSEIEVSLLIEKPDETAFCEAVNKLLNDPELYRRLAANCLKAREIYCWESERQKLLEIYQ